MSLSLATLIDASALEHVALIAFFGTCGLVLSFGTAVLALDRIGDSRRSDGGHTPPAWVAALFCTAAIAAGIVVLGVWAMTQKS